ncbi:MAG: EF-hand domain-containing protein [Gemmataceae bacterium]
MRLTRSQWLLLACLMVGLMNTAAQSQGPGGFPGGGGPGGDQGGGMRMRMGGGGPPIDFIFAMLAGKDKDGKINEVIDVSKVEAPPFSPEPTEKLREKLSGFMRSKGISGTILNKEQFATYFNEVARPEMEKNQSKQMFDFSDTNKDGKITRDELDSSSRRWGRPSPLLERFDEFDKNKDGGIDPDEYAAYMAERRSAWQRGETKRDEPKKETKSSSTGGSTDYSGYRTAPTVTPPPPSTENRPLVFRYGKLPTRDLPSWFVDLDNDKDGQVGLYEWRAGGKLTSEFRKYDINGDGFITAEEVLLVQRNEDAKDAKAASFARVFADPLLDPTAAPLPSSSGSTPTKSDKKDKKWDDKGKSKWDKGGWGEKGGFGKGKRP